MYEQRERAIIDALTRRSDSPPEDVVKRFVIAKRRLQCRVMADTIGGLLGPAAVRVNDPTVHEYESSLTALEQWAK